MAETILLQSATMMIFYQNLMLGSIRIINFLQCNLIATCEWNLMSNYLTEYFVSRTGCIGEGSNRPVIVVQLVE